jgi:transposase-like protein
MVDQVYRPRKPQLSPLWKCLCRHFYDFVQAYPETYEKKYGFLKPAVEEVVDKYLDCGDLSKGFARLHCDKCNKDYLLAFSCKGRWFCPSCHQKKVLLFGEFITDSVAYPLPHRQYVFSLPIMLRIYFRNNRWLLKQLCKIANECLLEFLRQVTHKPDGQLGMVMTIHTFGEYMGFNCHLHALVADGLFSPSGMFYVAPKVSTKPLEQIFRVRVIKMLVEKGLLAEELARKLLKWKHSGFSVHNGKPIKRNDTDGLKRVAQYIIRNPFSEQKMSYNEENGTVIYRSRMHAKTKRNFEVFSAEDFIAAITQHIPEKGFQMVRYYGWYSNRARGERAKKQPEAAEGQNPVSVEIIDVSDYQPRRLPSKKWRELIKQVWEVDPLDCPRCGAEMKLVALIDDNEVIERILRHLNLWPQNSLPARAPPKTVMHEYTLEPFFDGYSDYDEAVAG